MATRRPKVPRAQHDGDPRPAAASAPEPSEPVVPAATPRETGALTPPSGFASRLRAGLRSGSDQARNRFRGGRASSGKLPGSAVPASAAALPSDDEDARPIPAKAFSGRLLALAVVLLTITVLLAPTVRVYLSQRAEIAALQASIATEQARHTTLSTDASRWDDPNYVKQQARDRVNMVMPGDTGYWVYGDDSTPAKPDTAAAHDTAASAADPASVPWVDGLWQSIKRSAAQ